jgi:acyl-coenzyme A synthetase/AMP-(fatty) acid ligase
LKSELGAKGYSIEYDKLPSLAQIFPRFQTANGTSSVVTPFPARSKALDNQDIVFYLHSSGSTGFPKPIPQRQIAVLEWCRACEYRAKAPGFSLS